MMFCLFCRSFSGTDGDESLIIYCLWPYFRYKILAFPATAPVEAGPGSCMAIVRAAKLKDAQIGNSKVTVLLWTC